MSQSQSTSEGFTVPEDRREGRTALCSRENFWGEEQEDDEQQTGHSETKGFDKAEKIARNYVLDFIQPICKTTIDATPNRGFEPHFALIFDGEPLGKGSDLDAMHKENKIVELTDPCLHLPKQHDTGGRIIENRQHRLRRRYNPITGYINYGEPTGTGISDFDRDTFDSCVHNYLWDRYVNSHESDGNGLSVMSIEDYLEQANRLWHDPSQDSFGSLVQLVKYVRENEDDAGVSN